MTRVQTKAALQPLPDYAKISLAGGTKGPRTICQQQRLIKYMGTPVLKPSMEAGLDWDKKSALVKFGPGGPPPPYNIYIYIYIYIYMIYTTIQKFLNSKIFLIIFLKKSLLFTKPVFV